MKTFEVEEISLGDVGKGDRIIFKTMEDLVDARKEIDDGKFKEEFEKLESISIDYGVMEKKKDLAVVRAEMHWDDIGDWQAMERVHEPDKDGNVIKAEHCGMDTSGCIIFGDKMVATLGVKDLVIVNTKNAVLVCDKKRAQELKTEGSTCVKCRSIGRVL